MEAVLPAQGGAAALVVQGNRIVVGGWVDTGVGSEFALTRFLPNGTQDPTFGDNGVVMTATSDPGARISAVALQQDGKIVAVGGQSEFEVARYMPDGSLDQNFGEDGTVSTPVGSPRAVVIQPNGRIVVAGGSDQGFVLVRFLPDGSLDPSFGDGGVVITSLYSGGSWFSSLALQPDGKILAGGDLLARYLPDGTLDTSFGANGTVYAGNTAHLALQPDGKIIVGGEGWRLTRYLPDGSLDPTFGAGGSVSLNFGNSGGGISTLALQADGKIVVAGTYFVTLVRFNSDGSPDSSFGQDGVILRSVLVHGGIGPFGVPGIALQPDGRILAVGNVPNCCDGSDRTFAVMRFLGTPNCLVPDLRGKVAHMARFTVKTYGCRVGHVTRHYSRGIRKGRVISQEPAAELVTSPRTPVSFVISKGRRRG